MANFWSNRSEKQYIWHTGDNLDEEWPPPLSTMVCFWCPSHQSHHGIPFQLPLTLSLLVPAGTHSSNPPQTHPPQIVKINPMIIILKMTAPTMIIIIMMMLIASFNKTSSLCYHRISHPTISSVVKIKVNKHYFLKQILQLLCY